MNVVLAAAQQGVAADERRRSAFGLPLALAAERRYVGQSEIVDVMPTLLHPIFGQFDPGTPGFWDATLTFGGRDVTFDLTIDGSGVTERDMRQLLQKAEDIVAFDRSARLAILRDAQSGDEDSASTLYLTHHQSELPVADLERLFGTNKPASADPAAMLSRLVLVRVGLYPEHEDRCVLLDYSIDPVVTNYLLCVSFDSAGEPTAVDLES